MNYSWQIANEPLVEPVSLTEAKLHLRVDHTADDTLIGSLIRAARQYCENFQNRTYIATTYNLKLSHFSDVIELPRSPVMSVNSITYVDSGGTTQTVSSSVYELDTYQEPNAIVLKYGQIWPNTRGARNDITVNYTAGYSASFTAAVSDVCTCSGRTFTDGTIVRPRNVDGALPAGLTANTDYYVRDISGNTFKLYTTVTGGTAVDITDAGTGTQFIDLIPEGNIAAIKLLVGHLYEHREAVTETSLQETPIAVQSLLYQNRIISL